MKPLDQNLLRPNQIEELAGERDNLQRTLGQGGGPDGQLPGYRAQGSAEARSRLRAVDKMLRDQAPEPLTGMEKDTLAKQEKELRADIVEGMLSAEEMRKCPATAVDRHMRWENAKLEKIQRWKNIRLQLEAGTSDRDVANLEQYRPEHSGHRIMTDGVIPGLHAMSEQAKENWPLGDPKCQTALGQVKQRKPLSEEALAKLKINSAKGRAVALANRKAEAAPVVEGA